jgi:transposase
MRELSVAEQRYQAVLAVIADGLSISQVAQKVGVSRQTLHAWLARYEAQGLEGLDELHHAMVSEVTDHLDDCVVGVCTKLYTSVDA